MLHGLEAIMRGLSSVHASGTRSWRWLGYRVMARVSLQEARCCSCLLSRLENATARG